MGASPVTCACAAREVLFLFFLAPQFLPDGRLFMRSGASLAHVAQQPRTCRYLGGTGPTGGSALGKPKHVRHVVATQVHVGMPKALASLWGVGGGVLPVLAVGRSCLLAHGGRQDFGSFFRVVQKACCI